MKKIGNLLELYEQDGFRAVKVSGKEYQGPCPGCGGRDRFCLYPDQGEGKAAGLGSFHCGHGKGGNGCGKGGDAITYLQEFRGLSFQEACDTLGIDAGRPLASSQVRSPRIPRGKGRESMKIDPRATEWPLIVEDCSVWQEHGEKFVSHCHEELMRRQKSIDYLAGRGIDLAQIKKFRLGIHLGETRNGVGWEPSFRPRKSWGMRADKGYKKKGPQMFILPAGLVVPWYSEHGLRRIRIRLAKPDARNPKKKYHVVVGSAMDLWFTGQDRDTIVIVETELDAVMIDRFCEKAGVLALGSVTMKPDLGAAGVLDRTRSILNALDFDEAAVGPSVWWEENYPQCRRWPVPTGKDPGEAYEKGLDVNAWILAGAGGPACVPGRNEKTTISGPTGELADFLNLVRESGGVVRISGGDEAGVGFACNHGWSAANPEKREKITKLLYSTGQAGEFVCCLPAGNYSDMALRRAMEAIWRK